MSPEPIELAEFERKVAVRQLTMDDFDALVALQKLCFPGMKPWQRAQIQSQLDHFPEGQLCVEVDGQLAASSSSLVVDFAAYEEWHDWKKIADDGYIRNHTYEGDTLYGIEIMVHPDFRGMRLSRRLYDERKRLARELNLRAIIIAGRIPGYHRHSDEMSAEDYVAEVVSKALYDPVLTAQQANGFVLKRLIPNYLPGDRESCGFATFLEWTNIHFVAAAARARQRRWQAVAQVRLCLVQYQLRTVRDFDEFARQCEFFVDTGAEHQSDFVLFPELVTTQLLSCSQASRPGQAARKIAEFTSQYLELMGDLAIRYNVNIVGGSTFTLDADERLLNVSFLFRRDGTMARQERLHTTPSERKWWGTETGDEVRVHETDRGKVAILLGYDVEFPELARIAVSKGANILFVPFNTDLRSAYLRVRTCAHARAMENEAYVAIAGCVGNLPFVANADVHYAQSAIFTPSDFSFSRDGIAAEAMPGVETLVIQDVDLEQLRRHRFQGTNQNWNDRRKDLYQVVYRPGAGAESI